MNRKKSIYFTISLFAMIAIIAVILYRPSLKADVVILGDSNIGNFRDETGVSAVVERVINGAISDQNIPKAVSVLNGGFGGSTGVNVNEVSFVNLSKAIVNREFSENLALTAARDDGDLTYYDQALRDLSYVNYNNVKVLVVAYGTNDQLLGAGINEYVSAIKEGTDRIQKKYPDMKIIVVTPFYNEGRGVDKGQPSVEEYGKELIYSLVDVDADKFDISVDGLKGNVYKKGNLIVFDSYNAGIVNEENIKESTLDGVHLSEKARKQYGEILGEIIKSAWL